jgi:hypothetical protein
VLVLSPLIRRSRPGSLGGDVGDAFTTIRQELPLGRVVQLFDTRLKLPLKILRFWGCMLKAVISELFVTVSVPVLGIPLHRAMEQEAQAVEQWGLSAEKVVAPMFTTTARSPFSIMLVVAWAEASENKAMKKKLCNREYFFFKISSLMYWVK